MQDSAELGERPLIQDMGDVRVQWLAAHIAAHSNRTDTASIQQSLTSPKNLIDLTTFLDSSIAVLLATVHSSDGLLQVSLETSLSARNTCGSSTLAFVKTVPNALKDEDLQSKVLVSTLSGSAPTSLFHVLHNVYIPLLSSTNQQISPSLATLLSEVSAQLGKESAVDQEHDPLSDVSMITSALDEVRLKPLKANWGHLQTNNSFEVIISTL